MGLERRGCVVQPRPQANWQREEPVDKVKPFDIPKREVWGSLQACEGQPGSGRSRWTVDCGVRGQPFGQPLQALEPAVVRELFSSAGAAGRYSEGGWWDAAIGDSNCRRSRCPGGGPSVPGAHFGAGVPRRLLRLQARQICDRCRAPSSPALLALRLGARSRCTRLFRQYRLGAAPQGGPPTSGLPMGAAIRRALAEGAGTDGGRQRRTAHGRNAAGWGDLASPGEPVPALRVRHVDGAELSAYSVRALRGRCHLSLPKRQRGAGAMERACRSSCGLQAGAASGEDEDRLLQGCEPARRLSYHLVRLFGIPVSGPEDDVEGRHEGDL